MTKSGERELAAAGEALSTQTLYLGKHEEAINRRIALLEAERFVERLWQKDGTLWKEDEKSVDQIKGSLGWIDVARKMAVHVEDIYEFAAEALAAGTKQAVLMGMGGSSMAPLLFEETFSKGEKGMSLAVLDTTDPATVRGIDRKVNLRETLFVVASKSGTTAEPNAFGEYFFARMSGVKEITAGSNLAVITDPGSPLESVARERCYRGVIHNFKDIGGRYSALSYFGLLPAGLLGLDVEKLVTRALRMEKACGFETPIRENPGVVLGAVMGELAGLGVDKLTFLIPEAIGYLGLWLEQLIAESTGKEGTGILPIADEPPGPASCYGEDRFFVLISVKGYEDEALEKMVLDLKEAGKPVVVIRLNDFYDLAQEFYRFEIATATAGRILGINPFDQPNVQESKDVTKKLLKVVEEGGRVEEPEPAGSEGDLVFFTGLTGTSGESFVKNFLSQAGKGDYLALQAYLTERADHTETLQEIRKMVRDRLGIATTLGYGPRFLHSTGQFHKGGPNTGLFLQLTVDDEEDAEIPGTNYSFGILKRAQAVGDMEALKAHGRRIMRIHLGKNAGKGLIGLRNIISAALEGLKL